MQWKDEVQRRNKKYILPFFTTEEIWGFETGFGNYCKQIFLKEAEKFYPPEEFINDWERIFAGMVFSEFQSKVIRKNFKSLDYLKKIAVLLGRYSMINIDNIVTLPKMLYCYVQGEGYKKRAQEFRNVERGGMLDKFVILRRWQSYNPKIPRPRYKRVLGGGYFLMWKGKGIVIDPGYNFIENFYDQGFSLEDIDAIIITHSHPDHDDELSTILTLLHEWNTISRKNLSYKKSGKLKHVDLFLNEGSYRKYSSWVYAPNTVVKKIYQLQSNRWDRHTLDPDKNFGKRGENVVLDLTGQEGYSLTIEIIPAWHDEIIAKHSSIGIKLVLDNNESKKLIKIGITGDSYAYEGIENYYKDCDILVAHLGDIKFKEIRTLSNIDIHYHALETYFFGNEDYTKEKLEHLVDFLAQLDLVDIEKVLEAKDAMYLYKLIWSEKNLSMNKLRVQKIVRNLLHSIEREFKYENHLGINGLFKLHRAMSEYNEKLNTRPLLIIGEFPEELGSHRHTIARILNNIDYNIPELKEKFKENKYPKNNVRCFTGDVGLHVGIYVERNNEDLKALGYTDITSCQLMIRCHKCNQNNELVEFKLHYHPVDAIQEIAVKNDGEGMRYLCSTFNHASLPLYKPEDFAIKSPKN